ncbi:uncharacterized protein LOC106054364 [Biomphalaria glabrata]|uniref:Uncharacterized protein LOC106054364 n=1 Tax=Biomphalaria glabrata TaxID=6526 RepID=A0A2C9KJL9_BIOGL|nr:uncharacterized protein LOC106054364 [Biomphalaria glabrata]KAI8784078.1 hypothetical protein BgiBS90_015694 [Biomphalaria glabrata]
MEKELFNVLCVTVLLLTNYCMSTPAHHCMEPSDVELLALYKTLREGRFDSSAVTQKLQEKSTTTHIIPINGKATSKQNMELCQCNTKDEINFDPLRVPKAIPQSSCDKMNQHKFPAKPDSNRTYHAECKDVHHEMFVYRRGNCHQNIYQYTLQKERIKVGCSCFIRPNFDSSN